MNAAGYFATWTDDWQKAADIITNYLRGQLAFSEASRWKGEACSEL
jgi:hypothetical protein